MTEALVPALHNPGNVSLVNESNYWSHPIEVVKSRQESVYEIITCL